MQKPNLNLIYKTVLLSATLWFLVTLSNTAYADTYYVDVTGGSDTYDGLSQSTAWQTIAKVNSMSFNPGDSILFKRGEIWREQLTVSSSGDSTYPITYGAYGSGDKPIINGADVMVGFTGPNSNGEYTLTVPIQAYMLFSNGAYLNRGTFSSLGANEWDWYNGTLYLGFNPFGDTIEAGQRNNGIHATSKANIIYDNLHIKYTQETGIEIDGTNNQIQIIQNCTVENTGYSGIWIEDGTIAVDENTISHIARRQVSGRIQRF